MDIRLKQADISDHSWDFPDLVKKRKLRFNSHRWAMCSESGSKLFVLSGRKPAGGCKQAGGPDICILRLFSTCCDKPWQERWQRQVQDRWNADASSQSCAPDTQLRKKAGTEKSTRCFSVFTLTKKQKWCQDCTQEKHHKKLQKERLDINIGEDWQR